MPQTTGLSFWKLKPWAEPPSREKGPVLLSPVAWGMPGHSCATQEGKGMAWPERSRRHHLLCLSVRSHPHGCTSWGERRVKAESGLVFCDKNHTPGAQGHTCLRSCGSGMDQSPPSAA